MKLSGDKRLAVALLVVVAITLLYLVIGAWTDTHGVLRAGTVATVVAIGFALVKVRIIMREFMDVRHAPRVLRTATDAMVITMGVCVFGVYLIGKAIA